MKHLTSTEIVQLLTALTERDVLQMQEYFDQTHKLPQDHGYLVNKRIRKEASVKALIAALHQSTNSSVREILCDLLGELHAKTAVSALIACLEDSSAHVRSAASDALAKIRSPQAGEALMKRMVAAETDIEEQRMVAVALGAVGHRPAVPLLIKTLSSVDPSLRGSAAWSLGALQAREALDALEQAYEREQETYPRERMQVALDIIQHPNA